jgi:hypothetical protein
MATATVMTGSESIGKRLRDCRVQVAAAEQELKSVGAEIEAENDKLADLQSRRAAECRELVLGKKTDPSKHDAAIRLATDRISGLTAIRRTRERACADAKADLHNVEAEQSRIEQERALKQEAEGISRLIAEVESVIETRDQAAKTIVEGIASLRAWKYLAESHRRLGFDAAQRLERISNGMRP